MKNLVFSIYDEKAKYFLPPFMMTAIGQAVRAFDDLTNDPQSMICRHPEDFRLYQVASFDDQVGAYENLEMKVLIASAADLKTIRASHEARQLQLLQTAAEKAS